jgi:hypothetical protein
VVTVVDNQNPTITAPVAVTKPALASPWAIISSAIQ